uniref:Uncharacterized protein n=1 Tax=Cajanus cajan TaxID=3821 RepID=A0A151SMZ8_CAJCA|nr:hypothetical protein KK1_002392 [Cajanus cajan]
MKFPGHDEKIISVKANQNVAQQCYTESLKVAPLGEQCKSNLDIVARTDHGKVTDLNPRSDTRDERPNSVDELDDLQIGELPGQTTKIISETSHRRQIFNGEQNAQELAADLDLVDELRDEARIHEEACKLQASRRYNTRVKTRSFRAGDLVWRLLGEARKDMLDGKLAPTWGGPFQVTEDLENGAYRLEELSGKPIPRTWNATHLKFYFS